MDKELAHGGAKPATHYLAVMRKMLENACRAITEGVGPGSR
jgi:hypothetical protein